MHDRYYWLVSCVPVLVSSVIPSFILAQQDTIPNYPITIAAGIRGTYAFTLKTDSILCRYIQESEQYPMIPTICDVRDSARNNSNNSNMSSYLNWFEGLEIEFEFELIDVEAIPVHHNNLINILSSAIF